MRRFRVASLKTCRFQQTGGFGILEKKFHQPSKICRSQAKIGVKGVKGRERENKGDFFVMLVSYLELGQNKFRVAKFS